MFHPDLTAPKIVNVIHQLLNENVDITDAESIGSFIRQTLDEHNIKTVGAIFAVGRERAFLHHLNIPACPEDQVANLVRFQLAQELPFAIEEACVDYIITARNEQNYVTDVLACAIRTGTVDLLKDVARVANLKLIRIGLRPYANYLATKNLIELTDELVLFVNQRAGEIEIDAVRKSGLIFSRSVGLADENTDVIGQTILQLKRTVQICQADPKLGVPEKIVIAGSSGLEQQIAERANKELNISTEVLEPPIDSPDEQAFSWAFITLLGLASEHSLPKIGQFNFINPKRSTDPQAIRARQIRLAVAAVALVMILGIVYSHSLIADKQLEYAKLKSIDKKKARELRRFKKFQNQIESIKEWNQRKVNWLDEIRTITELMPSNDQAYVRSMVLVENKKPGMLAQIIIDGQAKSSKVVDQILQSFDSSGRYSEIKPGKQIPREQATQYPESFKIRLTIAKKHKSDKTK